MKSLAERIDYGIKKAAARELLEHKRSGRSIFILENGKVVEIKAEKIEIPYEFK